MKRVEPEVHIIGRPKPDWEAVVDYLDAVGVSDEGTAALFRDGNLHSPDTLAEFGGRLCYRSWEPGLNPNVTKVRTDHDEYLRNILKQGHGSVLEHISWNFVFRNVSRVLTHELVRHRPGVAISQESMRYVRLTDLPMWFPEWAERDEEFMKHAGDLLSRMEWLQGWMAHHWKLDEQGVPFHEKKERTSFMRRFAPNGVATEIMWTANARTLRHVIEARTSPGAEEEIRLVFGKVARLMQEEAPALFGDFEENAHGAWVPEWSKV